MPNTIQLQNVFAKKLQNWLETSLAVHTENLIVMRVCNMIVTHADAALEALNPPHPPDLSHPEDIRGPGVTAVKGLLNTLGLVLPLDSENQPFHGSELQRVRGIPLRTQVFAEILLFFHTKTKPTQGQSWQNEDSNCSDEPTRTINTKS